MRSVPSPTRMRASVAAMLAGALLLTACGSDDDDGASGSQTTTSAAGNDLAAQVASYDLAVGPPARFIAGVTTSDHRVLSYGTVQMRFAYLGTRESRQNAPPGPPLTGVFLPIPGDTVPSPLPTEPRLTSPSEGRGVYGTQVGFDKAGFWQVELTAIVDGRSRTLTAAFGVAEKHSIAAPGDPALPTENLTLASTDAPRAAIDSREAVGGITDPELHQTTVAAAIAAKRPAVVIFATPVYCVSMFCGPVTDMVQGLARTYGDRASFIHVEIWRDRANDTVNRAAAEWLLRDENLTEPWLFLIGADGKIVARFDNVVTQGELEPLLQQLPVIGPA